MAATAPALHKPPALLCMLFRLPWFLKFSILANRFPWHIYSGICRRMGWSDSHLGWYVPNNGPYAGTGLPTLTVNYLRVPVGG